MTETEKYAIASFYASYQQLPASTQRGIYEQAITTGGGKEAFNGDRLKHAAIGALAGVALGFFLFR